MSTTILITGASTGFGRDTAETLARAGHTVFASMRDPKGKNKNHAEALRKLGIEVIELDVSSAASVDNAVKELLKRARRIDVLVNNAGVASAGVTEAFTAEQAQAVFDVNVFGVLRVARAVLPVMRGQRAGLIVNIGVSAFEIEPPFVSGEPFRRHWKVRPSPLAPAEKEADWPAQTVVPEGFAVIAGADFKLKVAAEVVAVTPNELVPIAS